MAFLGLYTAFHSFWRILPLPRPIKSHTGANNGQRRLNLPLPFALSFAKSQFWGNFFSVLTFRGIGAPPRMRPAYSRRLCLPTDGSIVDRKCRFCFQLAELSLIMGFQHILDWLNGIE